MKLIVEIALSKILEEVTGNLISSKIEKNKENKVFKDLNLTIENFNEEFSESELDSQTFAKFLNNNRKVSNYFRDYLIQGDSLQDEEMILNEIIDEAILEINKKRVEKAISQFNNREILKDYFYRLKHHIKSQRNNNLELKDRMLVMKIRENIDQDMTKKLCELRDELYEMINKENQQKSLDKDFVKIGVRTYLSGTEKMLEKCNEFLDLSDYFTNDGKSIKEESFWNNEIKEKIEDFANNSIESAVETVVMIEAAQTIAFTLGYYANSKSNKMLYPMQSGIPWVYSTENRIGENELTIDVEEREGEELLVLIDLMDLGLEDSIEDSYPLNNLDVVKIKPTIPDRRYVLSGDHCMKLVHEVDNFLQRLPVRLKKKNWKFAFTSPNSFIFLLGRHAQQYGKIQLLHFEKNEFKYTDSISLG